MSSGVSNSQLNNMPQWQKPAGLDEKDQELLKTIYSGAVSSGDKTSHGRGYMGLGRTDNGNLASVKFMTHWYERGLLTDSKLMKGVAEAGNAGQEAFKASERLEIALRKLARKVGVEAGVARLIDDYRNLADYKDAQGGSKSLLSRKVAFQAANLINNAAGEISGKKINVESVRANSSSGHSTKVKNNIFQSSAEKYTPEVKKSAPQSDDMPNDEWIKTLFEGEVPSDKPNAMKKAPEAATRKQKAGQEPRSVNKKPVQPVKQKVKKINSNVFYYDDEQSIQQAIANSLKETNPDSIQFVPANTIWDAKKGGWKIGSKVIKASNGFKKNDVFDDNLLQQSYTSCCWFMSLLNGLKMTDAGRNHIKGVFNRDGSMNLLGKKGGILRVEPEKSSDGMFKYGTVLENTIAKHVGEMPGASDYVFSTNYYAEKGAKALGLVKDVKRVEDFTKERIDVTGGRVDFGKHVMNTAKSIQSSLDEGGVVVINTSGHYRSVIGTGKLDNADYLYVADSLGGKVQCVPLVEFLVEQGGQLPPIEFYSLPPSKEKTNSVKEMARENISREAALVNMLNLQKSKTDKNNKTTDEERKRIEGLVENLYDPVWFDKKFKEFIDSLESDIEGKQTVNDVLAKTDDDDRYVELNRAFRDYLQDNPD